jgi:hypothetical protein
MMLREINRDSRPLELAIILLWTAVIWVPVNVPDNPVEVDHAPVTVFIIHVNWGVNPSTKLFDAGVPYCTNVRTDVGVTSQYITATALSVSSVTPPVVKVFMRVVGRETGIYLSDVFEYLANFFAYTLLCFTLGAIHPGQEVMKRIFNFPALDAPHYSNNHMIDHDSGKGYYKL